MNEIQFKTGVIRPLEVYKEAWELIKDQYWLIFAITLVGLLIGGAVPIVLIGPMICGIYLCLFQRLEGRPASFELLFKGFDFFLPGLLIALIVTIPTIIFLIIIYIPMVGIAVAAPNMNQGELLVFILGVVVVELVVAVIMVCLHTLVMFAFPLVVDKKMPAWEAVKTSASAVWNNLAGIAGLFGVGIVVCIVGYMILCIGIYFVIPLVFAANTVAYRKIFPGSSPSNFAPPPPNYYQGL